MISPKYEYALDESKANETVLISKDDCVEGVYIKGVTSMSEVMPSLIATKIKRGDGLIAVLSDASSLCLLDVAKEEVEYANREGELVIIDEDSFDELCGPESVDGYLSDGSVVIINLGSQDVSERRRIDMLYYLMGSIKSTLLDAPASTYADRAPSLFLTSPLQWALPVYDSFSATRELLVKHRVGVIAADCQGVSSEEEVGFYIGRMKSINGHFNHHLLIGNCSDVDSSNSYR